MAPIACTGPLGYLLGGVGAGNMARRRGGLHGFLCGAAGIGIALVLGVVLKQSVIPVSLLLLTALPMAGWIGGWSTGR